MGVSGYFKWLINKYPNVMSKVIENHETPANPTDATEPNPNGFEIDNLYLDMNGIIHPCCHPEGEKQPESEEEMMVIIMKYLDRIFKAIRPRKLLYLAIDGVAPRAKMNQQRSRRYRSAKEAEKMERIKQQHIEEYEKQGLEVPDELKNESHWDSNVITPGTPFMDKVATALKIFINERITNDPAWRSIKVILTDSNSPGEGEHKIVKFIRLQRQQKNYNPNTSHCIHGLDADLIMLALATHEPHFYILREQIFDKGRPIDIQKKKAGCSVYEYKPLNYLHISVLREYLREEFDLPGLPFPYDFERIIDDYIFLCFFVGNDFLPHLPSMEIREGAIDMILNLYKRYLPTMGGYITDCGDINVERAQLLLQQIGYQEDAIFVNRSAKERKFEERRKMNERRKDSNRNIPKSEDLLKLGNQSSESVNPLKRKRDDTTDVSIKKQKIEEDKELLKVAPKDESKKLSTTENLEAKEQIESKGNEDELELDEEPEIPISEIQTTDIDNETLKFKAEEFIQSLKKKIQDSTVVDQEKHPDNIRFGEDGWKHRYFKNKLGLDYDENLTNPKINEMLRSYFEGLGWVLKYYYEGCVSWSWYYPYHYAPFASDLARVKDVKLEYELGTPFQPFTQLLAVFPKASAHALPVEFRKLMDRPDLVEFYPEDFEVDLNGKRFEWMGIALLPFIDEEKLLKAVKEVENTLTSEEKERNCTRPWALFVHKDHLASKPMFQCIEKKETVLLPENIDIQGSVFPLSKMNLFEFGKPIEFPSTYQSALMQVRNNTTVTTAYQLPETSNSHICHLLPGLQFPTSFLPIMRELNVDGNLEQTALVFKGDYEGALQHMRDHPMSYREFEFKKQQRERREKYSLNQNKESGYHDRKYHDSNRDAYKSFNARQRQNYQNDGYREGSYYNSYNQDYSQNYYQQDIYSQHYQSSGYNPAYQGRYHQPEYQRYNQGFQGYNQGYQGYNQGYQGYQNYQGYNYGYTQEYPQGPNSSYQDYNRGYNPNYYQNSYDHWNNQGYNDNNQSSNNRRRNQ